MDLRQEPVIVETLRYRVTGLLTLPREGYRSRLSDYVNQQDRDFFAIREAQITPVDRPGETESVPFVMLHRRHIIMVFPGEGASGSSNSESDSD